MFDPTVTGPGCADYSAFRPLVQALDRGVAAGSTARSTSSTATATASTRTVRWRPARRGSASTACTARRTTCAGSPSTARTSGEADWLKVTVQPRRDLLTLQQVPGA